MCRVYIVFFHLLVIWPSMYSGHLSKKDSITELTSARTTDQPLAWCAVLLLVEAMVSKASSNSIVRCQHSTQVFRNVFSILLIRCFQTQAQGLRGPSLGEGSRMTYTFSYHSNNFKNWTMLTTQNVLSDLSILVLIFVTQHGGPCQWIWLQNLKSSSHTEN
jgi:hypothetical protein